MNSGSMVSGTYDPPFVVLSFLIAALAAYAALDLTGRVRSSRSTLARFAWLSGGASAMGVGIWSMHYVGMIAFRMAMPILYDWPTVLLSLFAAILSSAVALWIAGRTKMGMSATIVGSVVMGAGIAAMHYIGMDAMRMAATATYSPTLVTTSIVIAIVIAFVALRLSFASGDASGRWTWSKGFSALTMGVAIPIMHYTGMAAAQLERLVHRSAAVEACHQCLRSRSFLHRARFQRSPFTGVPGCLYRSPLL